MDQLYDKASAANALEKWAELMANPERAAGVDTCTVPAHKVDTNRITVKRTGHPKAWKAMLPGESGREEAVLTLAGVLVDMGLPPVKAGSFDCGLNTPTFVEALATIQDVNYKILLTFKDGSATGWAPEATDNGPVISSSSVATSPPAGISQSRIKFHYIPRLLGKTTVHCIDKEVVYLNLIDNKFSKSAFIERLKAASAPKSIPSAVVDYGGPSKRRINYGDSDSEEDKPPTKLAHKMFQLNILD
ncbi:hypothetical protein C8J57DRAFT_1241397 [Mycena rebaudengoi]|nr:hypothetical protein C8J57DRAFT_1241397 [Mycena rebaudengoi]